MSTWYKITAQGCLSEITRQRNEDELKFLQTQVGGHIESIHFKGITGYVDDEGSPGCKNKRYNWLAYEIFGVAVYGVLVAKKGKRSEKIIEEWRDIEDGDSELSVGEELGEHDVHLDN